jgi:hypothetical protein
MKTENMSFVTELNLSLCSIPSTQRNSFGTPIRARKLHILRYATNQPSFFIEKQSTEPGSVLISEIIFNYGRLKVSADNINLQKFLFIHSYKDVFKNTIRKRNLLKR